MNKILKLACIALFLTTGALQAGVNESAYEILENGAGRFDIRVDDCPIIPERTTVEIEPLAIDDRELTTGADWDYRIYGPGDAHYGSITISSRMGANSRNLAEWWEGNPQTGCGRNIRKNISVIALKRDGSEARRYNFFECFPTRFESFPDPNTGEKVASLTCQPQGFSMDGSEMDPGVGEVVNDFVVQLHTEEGEELVYDPAWEFAQGGARCQERNPLPFGDPDDDAFRSDSSARSVSDVTLKGPLTSGRKALCEWITKTVQGKEWKRNVTVTEVRLRGRGGSNGRTYQYFDAFPIRYEFPTFDSESQEVLHETVVCKMQRVELQ